MHPANILSSGRVSPNFVCPLPTNRSFSWIWTELLSAYPQAQSSHSLNGYEYPAGRFLLDSVSGHKTLQFYLVPNSAGLTARGMTVREFPGTRALWFNDWRSRYCREAQGLEPHLYIDVQKSMSETRNTSCRNTHTARVDINVLESMIKNGADPKDITIATFLASQCCNRMQSEPKVLAYITSPWRCRTCSRSVAVRRFSLPYT